MNNLIFSDRLLIFISAVALIITLLFIFMIFLDLNNIWETMSGHKERISNLETLTLMNMSKIGCEI